MPWLVLKTLKPMMFFHCLLRDYGNFAQSVKFIFCQIIIQVKHILIIAFVVHFIGAKSQDPYAIHLNKFNGLPSNEVYNVFQDSKRFIWISSHIGLTRYDGFEYKSYHCDSQTSFSGSNAKEDFFGRVWYENFDGYLYYVQNDSLKAFDQKNSAGFIPYGLTEKHLFLIQKYGIEIYDLSNLKLIKIINKTISGAEHATSNKNYFYCILDNVIYKIDENLNVSSSDYFKDKSEKTKQIYCADSLVYIVGKYNEYKRIYIFNQNLKFVRPIGASEPGLIQGSTFIDNKIWLYGSSSTCIYSLNEQRAESPSVMFKNKSVSGLIKDRQNNYWISTTDEGIYLVPDLNTKVYAFPNFIPNKIFETKVGFYLATKKNELITCDKEFNIKSIESVGIDSQNDPYLHYDSVTHNFFRSSKKLPQLPAWNSENSVFYKSAVKEVARLDKKYYAIASTGLSGIVLSNEKSQASKSVWDSCFYRSGYSGQQKILLNNSRGKSVTYNAADKTIYFAANNGLFKCDTSETAEIKFHNETFYASKIIYCKSNLYALSTKGSLYKVTNNKDFVLLNPRLHIDENDVKLIRYFENKLVIVSSRSVYELSLLSNKVTLLNLDISPYEINDLLLKGETLYLISTAGVIDVSLSRKNVDKSEALFYLNEIFVNNKKYNPHKKNTFYHDQNALSLKFSILDFGTVNVNQLFYRINDGNWNLIENKIRSLQFAKLSPGDYKIEFKLNNELVQTNIEFIILPPFWTTGWFIALTSCMLFVGGLIFYKWQVRKLHNKNKLLEDKNNLLQEKIKLEYTLNKSVLTSIKSQMNPHFFYNALNTIQAYIFINDKSKANSYLAKFSKLTRVILEQSEKETISLSDEIESLTLYLELEKMRFKDGFEYIIDVGNIKNKERIELPPMLIQPYVENAVKHGLLHKDGAKLLQIVFEEADKNLLVTVTDNGIGRARSGELNKIKSEKYQSFATQANEKRLEILNKGKVDKVAVEICDKLYADGTVDGTIVKLVIPIF